MGARAPYDKHGAEARRQGHKTPQRALLYWRCAPRIRPGWLAKFSKLRKERRKRSRSQASQARGEGSKAAPKGKTGLCRGRPKVPSAWKGVRRTRIRKSGVTPRSPRSVSRIGPATRHPPFSSARATDASAIAWARKSWRSVAFPCHQTRCRSLTRREGRRSSHGSRGGWKCLRSKVPVKAASASLRQAIGAREGGDIAAVDSRQTASIVADP